MRRFSESGSRRMDAAATDVGSCVREIRSRAYNLYIRFAASCTVACVKLYELLRITNFGRKLKSESHFLLQRGTTPHTLARARRWRSSAARASWSIWYGRTMAGSRSRYAMSMGTPSGASIACRPNRTACWTTSKYRTRRVFFIIDLIRFALNLSFWSPFSWEMPRAELNSFVNDKHVYNWKMTKLLKNAKN